MSAETGIQGTVLHNRYEIKKHIDGGGNSVIFLAVDRREKKPVAVKAPRLPFEETVPFILNESEVLQRIGEHPNIVRLVDVFDTHLPWEDKEDEVPVLVTEFMSKGSLQKRIRLGSGMRVGRAIDIIGRVAEGLQAAHDAGIVHNDMTPRNLLFSRPKQVKIIDFAMASSLPNSPKLRYGLDHLNKAWGAPYYMAPEKFEGQENATAASDVYGLGELAFLALTGIHPVAHRDEYLQFLKHFNAEHHSMQNQPRRLTHLSAEAQEIYNAHHTQIPFRGALAMAGKFSGVYDGLIEPLENALQLDPLKRPTAAEFGAAMREGYKRSRSDTGVSNRHIL